MSEHSFPAHELWNSALYADVARSHLMTAELLSKREDEAGENYVGKPGRTWETVSGNHWITESFKIKAAKWPSPDAGTPAIHPMLGDALPAPGTAGPHPACTSHLQPAPRCTHTCNLDHVTPIHAVPAPAIQTTSSTCDPNHTQPLHGVFAAAVRTSSHLCAPPSHLQSRLHPTYTPRCCIGNADRLPLPLCTAKAAAGAPSQRCSTPAAQTGSHLHLPAAVAPPSPLRSAIPPCSFEPPAELRPRELLPPRSPADRKAHV